jgi:class 3 adenylate cyclase
MPLNKILLLFMAFVLCRSLPARAQFKTYAEKRNYLDSNHYFNNSKFAFVKDTLDKLYLKANAAGDHELAYEIKLKEYLRLSMDEDAHTYDQDELEKNIIKLANEAAQDSLHRVEADALEVLGNFYSYVRKRESESIEQLVAAYELYKNLPEDSYPPKQYNLYELGSAFYRYGDKESAIKYLKLAADTRIGSNRNMYCSIFNTIGMTFRQDGDYDSAIAYFHLTYDKASQLNNKAWMGISEGNIGITYFHQKKYEEAIPLLEQDIQTSMATKNVKNGVGTMAVLATIYNEQHKYDAARKMLDSALSIARSMPFWPAYSLAEPLYTQLSATFGAKGDYKLAWLYGDSAMMAKDSAHSRNNTLVLAKAHEKMDYLQHKLEAEKLQAQVNVGLAEISKKKVEVAASLVGFFMLIMVVLFIARERKRSENLLLNILPEKIAERLKNKEHPIADYFDHASIIFIDMAGFTVFTDGRDPKVVVNMLNGIFTGFDLLAEKHGLEKIKTIGDCYMAVSGLPEPNPQHAEAAAQMALDVKNKMNGFKAPDGTPIAFRIGLDCGPVVAGVIGRRKFIYDLWGDTVNTASRMESTGLAGEIHCSDRFKKKVEHKHTFTSKGMTEIKGKGAMETWLMVS